MRLLNLHCHSTYSDGSVSIEDLAVAFQKANHMALILTDHDYCMELEDWDKQKIEAEEISKKLNYPIIVGLEMHLKHLGEELLLFGAEACRSWFIWKKVHTVKYSSLFLDWYEIQKDRESHHPFALILAHPYLLREDPEFYKTLDGYEVTNGGLYWGDSYVKRMERLIPQAAQYHGMDVHYLAEMSYRCNEITDEDLLISNDLDLITFLKRTKDKP